MSGQVEITFASIGDAPAIVDFLRCHWRHDHIFVTHLELMRWQHESPSLPDDLNFVIAWRYNSEMEREILGLLGFIPFTRFDAFAEWSEVSLAIWKVRDDAGTPGLGLQLLNAIKGRYRPSLICAIGISQVVRPIYVALGYTVSALSHAALFPEADPAGDNVALGVPADARRQIPDDPGLKLLPVCGEALPCGMSAALVDSIANAIMPRKSWTYILNRYVRHPYYEYQLRAATVDGELCALLVWRKVATPYGDILRIVDIIGDTGVLGRCGAYLRREVADSGCQYIDIMQWGVSPQALAAGGFVRIEDHEGLVLPVYFEPFEQRNVMVEIAFRLDAKCAGKKVQLFRADSDQDRPNQPQAVVRRRSSSF